MTLRSCRKKTFVAWKLSSDHGFISDKVQQRSHRLRTATIHVGVGIQHGNCFGGEVARGLDDGHAGGVSNDLGVVEANDWSRDDVCAGRKVDNGRCSGRADAVGAAATVSIADDVIDGDGVVGD